MQLGFYFDQSRCSGCFACVVACKDWHDIPAGSVFWRRLITTEEGRFPRVSVAFFSVSCYHCARPLCLEACPVGAIRKREEDGIVVVDRDSCLGLGKCGGSCREACPYGAPQFGEEADHRMQKCDLCQERWAEGKKPICVQACPMRALDAGSLEELELRYGKKREEVSGLARDMESQPSILCKGKSS